MLIKNIALTISTFSRTRRHSERESQADPRSDMALDLTIPDREEQVSDEETHVGMVTSCYPRLQHSELHFGLERWHSTTVSHMIPVGNYLRFLRTT